MSEDSTSPGRNLAPRFEFIEWRLFWEGHLNRSDLEKRFGISTPQASVDLRNYRDAAGENIEYNATEKRFVGTEAMKPRFLQGFCQPPAAAAPCLRKRRVDGMICSSAKCRRLMSCPRLSETFEPRFLDPYLAQFEQNRQSPSSISRSPVRDGEI